VTRKKLIALFIALPPAASLVSLLIHPSILTSIFIFLVPQALILSYLNRSLITKSILFALTSIPVLLIIDFISHSLGQWIVPSTSFPIKLLGNVPIEDSIWVFILTYITIMFYEYFLDKHKTKKPYGKKFFTLAGFFTLATIIYYLLGSLFPELYQIKYFYLTWGTVGIFIPTALFLSKFPKVTFKFVCTGLYFFWLALNYELTALFLGWWYFPKGSEFIGWVSISGLNFPLEEFIFWLVLCAMGTLSWFEYFDDDCK